MIEVDTSSVNIGAPGLQGLELDDILETIKLRIARQASQLQEFASLQSAFTNSVGNRNVDSKANDAPNQHDHQRDQQDIVDEDDEEGEEDDDDLFAGTVDDYLNLKSSYTSTITLDSLDTEEENDNNLVVELDIHSWEEFKRSMSEKMLNYTAHDIQLPTSSPLATSFSRSSSVTSMSISVDAKAPDSAPIECDPFKKYDHRDALKQTTSTITTEINLSADVMLPPLLLANVDATSILQHLDFSDILSLAAVCKYYLKYIDSDARMWKKLYARYEGKIKDYETNEDSNIWKQAQQPNALNDLVTKLTPTNADQDQGTFLDSALSQFRELNKPWSLLIKKLIQRYMVPPPSWFSLSTEEWKSDIVSIVCPKVLGILVQVVPRLEGITSELVDLLKVFVRGFVIRSYPDAARALLKVIDTHVSELNAQQRLEMCCLHLLPHHIVVHIFNYLGFEDLCAASQTCTNFHEASMNADLWKSMYKYYDAKLREPNQDESNIWDARDDTTFKDRNKTQISHASLNNLVALLTPEGNLPDATDIKTFLLTYSTFTTSHQLMRKLIQRYDVPEPGEDVNHLEWSMKTKKPIQLRVIKIMKIFIEGQPEMKPNTRMLLNIFIKRLLAEDPSKAKPLVVAVKRSLKQLYQEVPRPNLTRANSQRNSTFTLIRRQIQRSFEGADDLDFLFDESTPEEIAKQLTLIEFEYYSAIKAPEFFKQAWAKPSTQHKAPNIRRMIDRFNKLTSWLCTMMVTPQKAKKRAKRMTLFIQIARALRNLHNYHTLMAFITALNETAVFRLRFTKDKVSVRWQNVLKELEALMSADGSYKNFRKELSLYEAPAIPYLGVYLRDLTYFDEDNSSSKSDVINFKQRKNIYSVIYLIQNYQQKEFPFRVVSSIYNVLKKLDGTVDSDQLFEMSLEREPKNSSASVIQ